jgi:hypothetical protein
MTQSRDLEFVGKVSSRTRGQTQTTNAPSETDILRLNPQRQEMILKATGWTQLAPGTLNLEVEPNVAEQLLSLKPLIDEPGTSVKYP